LIAHLKDPSYLEGSALEHFFKIIPQPENTGNDQNRPYKSLDRFKNKLGSAFFRHFRLHPAFLSVDGTILPGQFHDQHPGSGFRPAGQDGFKEAPAEQREINGRFSVKSLS